MTSESVRAYKNTIAHLHIFVDDGLLALLAPELDADSVDRGLYMLHADFDYIFEHWIYKWVGAAGAHDFVGLLKYAAHIGTPVMLEDTVLDHHIPTERVFVEGIGWSVRVWNDLHAAYVHLRYVR